MAIKLSKKFLCISSTILTMLALSLTIYLIATANTKPSTVAILDHAATVLFSKSRTPSFIKRDTSVRPVDINGKICSPSEDRTIRSQVGIFTDLCEVMTGRNDGCIYKHPEIVHFVKFTNSLDSELTFQDFLSVLSVHKFYKPENIIIHSNAKHFNGTYWNLSKKLGTTIKLQYTDRIRAVGKSKQLPSRITHEADILKVQTMLQEGGIFMDFDSVILNGTQLRATQRLAECVIGSDTDPCTRLCAGFMSCVPNSTFVEAWWQGYQENYVPNLWVYNAGTVPSNILRSCTSCYDVYVDRTISNIKTAYGKVWLTRNGVDWRTKAVVHYMHSNDITPNSLLTNLANTSLADMFLYILDDYLPTVLTKVKVET